MKFADDTKLFRKNKAIGDKKKLQDDIDQLVRWSEKWQMLLNFGNCKCLHTRPGNSGVARGGQGGHAPPKLLLNVFFLQLIPGNLEVTRKCPKNFPELR